MWPHTKKNRGRDGCVSYSSGSAESKLINSKTARGIIWCCFSSWAKSHCCKLITNFICSPYSTGSIWICLKKVHANTISRLHLMLNVKSLFYLLNVISNSVLDCLIITFWGHGSSTIPKINKWKIWQQFLMMCDSKQFINVPVCYELKETQFLSIILIKQKKAYSALRSCLSSIHLPDIT